MRLLKALREKFVKQGVEVRIVVLAPENTPAGDTVWITGDCPALGAWDAAGVRMIPTGGVAWEATVRLPADRGFEFKATRGTWQTVERHRDGGDTANHFVSVEGLSAGPIRHTVERWSDLP